MNDLPEEFARFPAHWKVLPFTDAVKDATSGNKKLPKQKYSVEGIYPVVDQGQAQFGGYTDEESLLCKSSNPTIVFGDHTRSFKYVTVPFVLGADGAKVLEPKIENLDKRFLFHYLKQLNIESAGYSRHFKFLKETFVPVPPLDEQKRIATILDKADAIRQKRKQAIDLADDFLRSVFLDMFGDPVTNPKGWEVKPFGSVIDTLTDYHANGSYKTLNENVTLLDEPNYAYMVRTTDLEKRNYADGVKYIDKHAYEHLSKSKVFGGEIIVNKIGSAGALYLMPKLNRPVSLAMNQFMVRCKEGQLNEFYFHQLCTNAGTSEIKKRVQGAVTKTITKNALREVPVLCPSEEKQRSFVNIVEAFNSNLLCGLKESYKVSCEFFDSLSQKAFSGQL